MRQGEKIKLTITDINNSGEGIVRIGDERFVLFVPDALPGEEVTCRIIRKKRNYAIAKVLERHNDSPNRIKPLCPSYGKCGGCQLQHLNYATQLKLKTQTVYDAMKRIAGIAEPTVEKCIPSPSQWEYRNKATIPVQSNKRDKIVAGYYKKRSHEIVPFLKCPVLLPKLEENISLLLKELTNSGLNGWNNKQHNVTSFIRHLVLRTTKYTDKSLCAIIAGRSPNQNETKKLENIAINTLNNINGIIFNKNSSTGNFVWGEEYSQISGKSEIQEKLGKFRFNFEISSFFQINSEQTVALCQYVANLIPEGMNPNTLELYSGVGALTLFIAEKSKHVTAVEEWPHASKYLKTNAQINKLDNITGISSSAEEVSESMTNEKFDIVVLDPPRSGCDQRVIAAIIKISPQKIIYVSCDPATLARDIKSFI